MKKKQDDFILKFGKYKGRNVKSMIYREELKYLQWCLDNYKKFESIIPWLPHYNPNVIALNKNERSIIRKHIKDNIDRFNGSLS